MASPETVASYRCGWWWSYPDVWGKFACGENLPTLTLINFRSCAKSCRDEHQIWVRQIHHSWVADPFIATPRKNHHRRSSWGKEKTHLRCTHGKWSLYRSRSPNAKLKMKRWLLWWNASCNWVPDTVPHPSFSQIHSWLHLGPLCISSFQLLHLKKSMIFLQQKKTSKKKLVYRPPVDTPPKFNSSPLKSGACRTSLSYWVSATFQGLCQTSRGYCSTNSYGFFGDTSTLKPLP